MSDVNTQIDEIVSSKPVVLFMKGNKDSPQCGFSAQVVNLLKAYQADFEDVDVLENWEIREGIKSYSNWPTIPQLYVKGDFVGGCDIAMELHRKGELAAILEKAKEQ